MPKRKYGPICIITDCGRPHASHGWCDLHYRRWLHHGDPTWTDSPTRSGRRKWTLNETFFDAIDNERAAYWLGFIGADGCVPGAARDRGCGVLVIELSDVDSKHLQKLCDDLGSNRPLRYTRANQVMVQFGSNHMADSLRKLGISPHKSVTLAPWDGPSHLMPHYWRGMFDGDGWLYQRATRPSWSAGLVGSSACVRAFSEWARPITGAAFTPSAAKGGTWKVGVEGLEKVQALAHALYANAEVALERKARAADELLGIDVTQRKAAAGSKRSASLHDAWTTGRHGRSVARP
jgi:hypothetical protein